MNSLALTLRQVKFENRAFWRNPPAAFFTVIFPLMFLVVFNLLFGNDVDERTGLDVSTFYVPAIAALSVISACYTNLAITTSLLRDQGILKRVRGTPLPAASYLFGRILHASLIALLLVVVVTVAGALLYGVDAPSNTAPAALVTVIIGAACFSSLGIALTGAIRNGEASPAITNGTILPLMFISDIFVRIGPDAPSWLESVASIFPIIHFSRALQTAFNPLETGAGFEWGHLAVLGIWTVVGSVLALRFFSWEPRK